MGLGVIVVLEWGGGFVVRVSVIWELLGESLEEERVSRRR